MTSSESDWKSLARHMARADKIPAAEHASSWNILTVDPRRENTAAAFLSARGFEPYNPTFQRYVRAGPSCSMPYRKVDWPIFDGYLFVRTKGPEQDWPVIRNTVGVRGWLSTNGTPARLSDDAINGIREIEEKYRERARKRSKSELKVGMRVRVDRRLDAFHGMVGILQRLDKRDRAMVLLMVPGRNVWPIRVAARWLKEVC